MKKMWYDILMKKIPINKGDAVRYGTKHYTVIRLYKTTCWLQARIRSKILTNDNPIIKNIPIKGLKNKVNRRAGLRDLYYRKREKYIVADKKWREQNKERDNITHRKYLLKRFVEDPDFFKKRSEKTRSDNAAGNWRILLKTN